MGLMKEYKEFKAKKKAEEALFAIFNTDQFKHLLERIDTLERENAELKGKVAKLEKRNTANTTSNGMSDKDKKKLEAMLDGKTTPEDFVNLFADEREEFYPNGRN